VYTKDAWDVLLKRREADRHRQLALLTSNADTREEHTEEPDSDTSKADFVRLKIRGKSENMTKVFLIRKDKSIAQVIEGYRKECGVAREVTIRLSFEGEALAADQLVGEVDFEDGDMLDAMLR